MRPSVLALAVLLVLVGCLGGPSIPGDGSDPPTATTTTPAPRPAANATVVYGPGSPQCEGLDGDAHYGAPLRYRDGVPETPSNLSVRGVERFVEERFDEYASITLREEKYERVEFRGRTFDVSERYDSDRYYHGDGGDGDLLVVIYDHSTAVIELGVGYC